MPESKWPSVIYYDALNCKVEEHLTSNTPKLSKELVPHELSADWKTENTFDTPK